jgi:DNA polymerase III delta subunit
MIYLLHGADTTKSRNKLRALLDSMFVKRPNASFIRVQADEFEENMLKEFVGGQGLFTNKYIIVFDNLFSDKNTKDILLKSLKEISESQNIFIFLEEKLNKTELNKFDKYAEKIQSFEVGRPTSNSGKKFDIFSLANALGKRDKKNLWVLYQKAKMNNIADEQIHGILFWKIKDTILSSRSDKYSQEELKKLSNTLVSLYHDVRRGVHEMDSAMERFILRI